MHVDRVKAMSQLEWKSVVKYIILPQMLVVVEHVMPYYINVDILLLGDRKPVGKVVVASSCHAYATDLCVNISRITDN